MFEVVNMTSRKDVRDVLKLVVKSAEQSGESLNHKLDLDRLAKSVAQVEEWIATHDADSLQGYHPEYPRGFKRLKLHSDIVKSLATKVRPENPSSIGLKQGGALPCQHPPQENKAFFIIGPPASGKSSLAEPLAKATLSVIVDPDDAKMCFPEYRQGLNATFLHEESSELAKGKNSVLTIAVQSGYNVSVVTVGGDQTKLENTRDTLVELGYRHVYLVCVACPAEITAFRSLERFQKTGRYVPLKHILSEVGDKPMNVFQKSKLSKDWAGYALYSSKKRNPETPLELIESEKFEWDVLNTKGRKV